MTRAELLRPWLAQQGYRFLAERLVYENHTYFPVIAVTGGGARETLTPGQAWGGILLQQDPLQGSARQRLSAAWKLRRMGWSIPLRRKTRHKLPDTALSVGSFLR